MRSLSEKSHPKNPKHLPMSGGFSQEMETDWGSVVYGRGVLPLLAVLHLHDCLQTQVVLGFNTASKTQKAIAPPSKTKNIAKRQSLGYAKAWADVLQSIPPFRGRQPVPQRRPSNKASPQRSLDYVSRQSCRPAPAGCTSYGRSEFG